MATIERTAFGARTRRIGLLLALAGAALTALAVAFKPPFVGTAALVTVLGGTLWVAWRYLLGLSQDRAPPGSR